jgi:hypothetical protein
LIEYFEVHEAFSKTERPMAHSEDALYKKSDRQLDSQQGYPLILTSLFAAGFLQVAAEAKAHR